MYLLKDNFFKKEEKNVTLKNELTCIQIGFLSLLVWKICLELTWILYLGMKRSE